MADAEADLAIRLAAFRHLSTLKAVHGDTIRREVLGAGFMHDGELVRLIGPQGIFIPKQLDLPLTVTTSPESARKPRTYADAFHDDGFLSYRYRGTDPGHRENAGLRRLMQLKRPLIYLHGTVAPRYVPVFPVFVVGDDPHELTFRMQVALADARTIQAVAERDGSGPDPERRYATRQQQLRLHQALFRDRVLEAYEEQCTLCHLKHTNLLDAAHIRPDAEGGSAAVRNGLAMCKLHHAAYDSNILGIRTDLRVEVNASVLEEIDGPMLRYGLQEMHGAAIQVPRRREWQPDREALEWRYRQFRDAQ